MTTSRWFALVLVLMLGLAACGGGEESGSGDTGGSEAAASSGSEAGSEGGGGQLISENFDLSGTTVRFGSKDFTEQLILGQIAAQALQAAGAEVDLTENLPSPAGPRDAITAGELDAAWEYTGTAWINYLGNEQPIDDPMEQWRSLKEQDLEENNIFWTEPAPFDDTYGIATNQQFAEENDLETLEDVANFVEENPDEATFCLDSTFGSRDDGLPRFEETFDVTWPEDNLIVQDFGVIYDSTAKGNPCNFGEVFTTDGRIQSLDLALMEDTSNVFISYLSSVMMPNQFYEDNQRLADLFVMVGQPLDEERMTGLNAAVDVDGEFPEDVAAEYLREEGFIE
ncbi:MAG: glycine/betaine ABC transporter substrate-binding protein [Actinobacteria bacterium]|nr:glycine/betaine ABC transporter substrate-binding protein [Actinomycetota bacterium]